MPALSQFDSSDAKPSFTTTQHHTSNSLHQKFKANNGPFLNRKWNRISSHINPIFRSMRYNLANKLHCHYFVDSLYSLAILALLLLNFANEFTQFTLCVCLCFHLKLKCFSHLFLDSFLVSIWLRGQEHTGHSEPPLRSPHPQFSQSLSASKDNLDRIADNAIALCSTMTARQFFLPQWHFTRWKMV